MTSEPPDPDSAGLSRRKGQTEQLPQSQPGQLQPGQPQPAVAAIEVAQFQARPTDVRLTPVGGDAELPMSHRVTERIPISHRVTEAVSADDVARLQARKTEIDAILAVPRRAAATDPAQRVTDARPGLPEIRQPGRKLAGTILADRYELIRELARGGMGEVYLARHLALDTPVAVKVMLADLAMVEGYERRFHREARAMSLLSHPNVVRVYDYGIQDGLPFIVMEMLDGESVARWMTQLGRLPSLAEVDAIMRQLCDAFEMAHATGIVHRDLKPDNLFLSNQGDGRGVLKVLDFGLARIDGPAAAGLSATQSHFVSGTPEYMSPEQCRSLSVSSATDIYAMGCVLSELLQGFPPFAGPSHADIMTQQMFVAPPPLERPADAEPVPPLLERLRLDLLQKSPQRRPANMRALRERWLEAMDQERSRERLPPRKVPPPLGDRSQRQQQWSDPAPPIEQRVDSARVGVIHLHDGQGLDQSCTIGLAAAGMTVVSMTVDVAPSTVDIVFINAGDRVAEACQWLSRASPQIKAQLLARPVVCVDQVDAGVLNRLIAAGAGDVVVYPVELSVLTRKLRRALRKADRSRGRDG